MKDIAIYGAGGLGREVMCLIKKINEVNPQWNIIGFFDDGIAKNALIDNLPVYGGINELNAWPKPLALTMAIGNPSTISFLVNKIVNTNIEFPNIIAPDVISYGNIQEKIGYGNLLGYGCILSCDTHIGNFNIFNGYVSLGHDSHIGNYNVVMPGVKLSGDLIIGDANLFGANSFVHQQIRIGSGIRLGACSALLRKPKDNCTYVGNPAVLIKI